MIGNWLKFERKNRSCIFLENALQLHKDRKRFIEKYINRPIKDFFKEIINGVLYEKSEVLIEKIKSADDIFVDTSFISTGAIVFNKLMPLLLQENISDKRLFSFQKQPQSLSNKLNNSLLKEILKNNKMYFLDDNFNFVELLLN